MINLVKITVYRDGGTSVWVRPEVKASVKTIQEALDSEAFYLDNRIGSSTKGELFDKYPGKEGAIMLDKTQYNFL